MTTQMIIKVDRESRKKYEQCTTKEELDQVRDLLYLKYEDDEERDYVIDNYLKAIQQINNIQRNTKNVNEYSWLTTRTLKKREKNEIEYEDYLKKKDKNLKF